MNISLRQAVLQKVREKNTEELSQVVDDSVGGDDRVLPGLGVLFEIIWEHSEPDTQKILIQTLKEHMPE